MLSSTDGVTVSYNVNLDKAELSASFVYDKKENATHNKSIKIYYECTNGDSEGIIASPQNKENYKAELDHGTKTIKLTSTEKRNLQYVDFDIIITNVGSYNPYWAKCWH